MLYKLNQETFDKYETIQALAINALNEYNNLLCKSE